MFEAEVQAKILSLYFSDKKSIRAISILVGVDRKTVKRIIDRRNFGKLWMVEKRNIAA